MTAYKRMTLLILLVLSLLTVHMTASAEVTSQEVAPQEISVSSEPPVGSARLIVSDYALSSDPVLCGDGFTITLTLRNTSNDYAAKNIKLMLKDAQNEIIPERKIGSIYVDRIAADSSKTLSIQMKASASAKTDNKALALSITYEDDTGKTITDTDELYVPVRAPLKLEFDEPSLPERVVSGETIPLRINCYNRGTGTVNNIVCTIEGDGLVPESRAFFGNMASGEQKTQEVYILITRKNMNSTSSLSDEDKYGQVTANVQITYEDMDGKSYSETMDLTTSITAPVQETVVPQTETQDEPTAGQWWISITVIVLLIGAVVAVLCVQNHKKRKALQNNEMD